MTDLPRRDFLKFATGACALAALSLRPAAGQLAVNPPQIPATTSAERAAMGQLVLAFMDKYDAPALSFAIGITVTVHLTSSAAIRGRVAFEPRQLSALSP